MAVNFSEEEITQMYQMYEEVLGEIQNETQYVVEHLGEKAQRAQYKPVTELSIEAVRYYNEELKDAELKALKDWQDSEISFSKIMDELSAGEDAKNRGKMLEVQIEEEIQSWRSMDFSQLSAIPNVNMNISERDFEEIEQMIEAFTTNLEEKQNQYARKIEERKEENTIYVAIEPVILQSIEMVTEGFRSGIKNSFNQLGAEFSKRDEKIKGLGSGTAQSVASNSQKLVSDGIAALRAKTKQIWD